MTNYAYQNIEQNCRKFILLYPEKRNTLIFRVKIESESGSSESKSGFISVEQLVKKWDINPERTRALNQARERLHEMKRLANLSRFIVREGVYKTSLNTNQDSFSDYIQSAMSGSCFSNGQISFPVVVA